MLHLCPPGCHWWNLFSLKDISVFFGKPLITRSFKLWPSFFVHKFIFSVSFVPVCLADFRSLSRLRIFRFSYTLVELNVNKFVTSTWIAHSKGSFFCERGLSKRFLREHGTRAKPVYRPPYRLSHNRNFIQV